MMGREDLHRSAGLPPRVSASPQPEPAPPGARAMNVVRWVLFVVLVVFAVAAIAAFFRGRSSDRHGSVATTGTIYYCPMHPFITSDKPGECPICGMTLEPRPAGAADTTSAAMGDVPQLTTVHLTPERIQMIGVRTVIASRGGLGAERELVGFVAPDEGRLSRVQLRVSGWIERLDAGRVGDRVARGEPLLSIYSPELYQTEREFLIAVAARDSGLHSHDAPLIEAARSRLRLLGVPEEEVARLERTREPSTHLTMRSPVTGTVLERNAVAGQYVGPDTPLLTLADLSRVWVLADLYERDLPEIRAGSRVTFTTDALPGRALEGRLEFVYPTIGSETRTAKGRIVLDNHRGELRPGMYGRVHVRTGGGSGAIVLPADAVVDDGERRYVFLAHAEGRFEPRRVVIGREESDWIEILSGIAAGDTVVASGSFLIDSESRLEAALGGMGGATHQHGGPR